MIPFIVALPKQTIQQLSESSAGEKISKINYKKILISESVPIVIIRESLAPTVIYNTGGIHMEDNMLVNSYHVSLSHVPLIKHCYCNG